MRRLCKSSAVRAQVLLNSVPVGTVHSKERALRREAAVQHLVGLPRPRRERVGTISTPR